MQKASDVGQMALFAWNPKIRRASVEDNFETLLKKLILEYASDTKIWKDSSYLGRGTNCDGAIVLCI